MRNLPRCIPVWYENNPRTGYYTKSANQPSKHVFQSLPFELRVEKTQIANIRANADTVIRGRDKTRDGNYKFFTGLVQIYDTNCYVGNNYRYLKGRGKVTDLVIFCFSQDNSKLRVFYFPGFDKRTIQERVEYAAKVIPELLNNHIYMTEGVL